MVDDIPITSNETATSPDETISDETQSLKVSELKDTHESEEKVETEPLEQATEDNITYTKVDDIIYIKSSVNVRKGPSTSYKKLGSLNKGHEVQRIGITDNGWGVIIYKGEEAFVSGKYLVENKPIEIVEKKTESKDIAPTREAVEETEQEIETESKLPEEVQVIEEGTEPRVPNTEPSSESQPKPPESQAPAETSPKKEPLLVEQIKGIGSASQVITVTSDSASSVQVTVQAFEKVNDKWQEAYSMPGVIGSGGFTSDKIEGDKKAPVGIYTFGTAFGTASNPGTSMPYRQTTSNDYWVDDVNSPLYNTWQEGPCDGRWQSAESLSHELYKYAIAINYNTEAIPGKGSCIFMHVWRRSTSGTAGCIAVSESNLVNLLKWLDPSKAPIIVLGSKDQVLGM